MRVHGEKFNSSIYLSKALLETFKSDNHDNKGPLKIGQFESLKYKMYFNNLKKFKNEVSIFCEF